MKNNHSSNPVNPLIGGIGVQTILAAALAFALALTSCGKGGGDVKLLESITDDSGKVQKKFEYDEQSRIVKVYDYNKDGKLYYTKTITYANNSVTVEMVMRDNNKFTNKYDMNGNDVGSPKSFRNINEEGYIVAKKYESGEENDDGSSASYEYLNGNLIKLEQYDDTGPEIVNYKYDDKKSPFSNTNTPKWILQEMIEPYYACKNNVLEVYSHDDMRDYTYTAEYEYEYDSDGFPTKQTGILKAEKTGVFKEETRTTSRYTYITKTKTAAAETEPAAAKTETAAGEKEPGGSKPEEVPPGAVLTVSTAWEFIAALGSNRTIELKPGRYNLSQLGDDAPMNSEGYINSEFLPEGVSWYVDGVSLRGIRNLTIRGAEGGSQPEIVVDPNDGYVLSFVDCSDIVIDGITAGHTVGGHCTGGVFSFEESKQITINNTAMYGSGTEGLTLTNVFGMKVTNSRIYECTYHIMTINGGGDIAFEKCKLDNNGRYSMVNVNSAKNVSFTDCEFIDNVVEWGSMFAVWNTAVAVSRCTFRGNKVEGGYIKSANSNVSLLDGKSSVLFSDCEFDNAFIDKRDGNVYKTVKIGGKVWTAENLSYEAGKSWCYQNNQSYCAAHGRLYDWNTATEACPEGWHLPSAKEWDELVKAAGGEQAAGKRLKPISGWADHEGNSGNGTDDYGFSALPGGFRTYDGDFRVSGSTGMWWTATTTRASAPRDPLDRIMYSNSNGVQDGVCEDSNGLSVRCVRD
jgi:uncharacterized protein (TIGR02145 family)